MPLRILTNTQSLFAQQALGVNQKGLAKALERLSTGKRINHSYDDAAGYLFSVQTAFNYIGVDAGTNNLRMAVDALNTADSYTQLITDDLQRMADLADQAHNGLLTADQRAGLNFEFVEIQNEIGRVTQNASYNKQLLLDGTLSAGITIQSGYSMTDLVNLSIQSLTTGVLLGGALTISTMAGASTAIQTIASSVITILSPTIAGIGAQAAAWGKTADAQDVYSTNLKAARSRVWDADIAAETTNLTNAQVIVQSGIAALAQANTAQSLALGLIGR
jgi:flagellin